LRCQSSVFHLTKCRVFHDANVVQGVDAFGVRNFMDIEQERQHVVVEPIQPAAACPPLRPGVHKDAHSGSVVGPHINNRFGHVVTEPQPNGADGLLVRFFSVESLRDLDQFFLRACRISSR
jgi:hypothetical protein